MLKFILHDINFDDYITFQSINNTIFKPVNLSISSLYDKIKIQTKY